MIEAGPDGEARLCGLTAPLNLRRPPVGHYLKLLADAGLVARGKRGTWAWHAIVRERLEALHKLLH